VKELSEDLGLGLRTSLCGRNGPHDFRRIAVRNLEWVGVPRSAAMAMVEHRSQSIYRYLRYVIADEMLKLSATKLVALPDSHDDARRSSFKRRHPDFTT
jgi:hypothetical protein